MREITTARRRVRPLVVALAALALVLALSGFGAYALTREPTHVDSIGCFDRADLDADVAVIGSEAVDPVAACAAVWRSGAFGGSAVAPTLTPCVLDTGAVAVLPGSSGICESLGIADLAPDARRRLARLGELRAALTTKLGGGGGTVTRSRCVGEGAARRLVAAELAARGYGDWTIELALPFDAERRCASVSLRPGDRVVELVPVWP